jgi:plastocyanin
MPTSRTALLAAAALLAALGTAGCGDTTDDAAAEPVDCAAHPGQTVTVEIGDFVFDPTPVQVEACDSVVWHNGHDQAHTATATGAQAWNTGNLQPDATSEPVAFPAAGDFTYMCALHPFMKASVEVS